MLVQDQYSLVIQCNDLVERFTADTSALAPLETGLLPIAPESSSAMDI